MLTCSPEMDPQDQTATMAMASRPQATRLKVTVMTEWTPGPASPTEWPVTPGAFFHRGSERSGSTAQPGSEPSPHPRLQYACSNLLSPSCAWEERDGHFPEDRIGGVHPLSGQPLPTHPERRFSVMAGGWPAGITKHPHCGYGPQDMS